MHPYRNRILLVVYLLLQSFTVGWNLEKTVYSTTNNWSAAVIYLFVLSVASFLGWNAAKEHTLYS